jgi:arabinogalactan oligomer/maltooligosaccharide transport system substrate-binding protein
MFAADPRRPALITAADKATATDPNIPKFVAAAKNGTIMPAIPAMGQVWVPFGTAEANIVGGADPETALKAAAKAIRDGIAAQQ